MTISIWHPSGYALDIIANTAVLAAWINGLNALLPDLVMGLFLTFVFAKSAGKVLSQSWRKLQRA